MSHARTAAVVEPTVSVASLTEIQFMYDEQLVEIVEHLCFAPIRSAVPYIAELRSRFARRKRGHAHIANCATWEQFCLKVLQRKPNTIPRPCCGSIEPKRTASASQSRMLRMLWINSAR